MAEGLSDGRNGESLHDGKSDWSTTLISYHSMTSSSKWFHDEPWLDFHMWGTYHSAKDWPRSFQVAAKDYALSFPKPTLNAEPPYEEHPRDYDPANGWFEDYEIRRAAWWSVMSGTLGHTYGAHPVWQFYHGHPFLKSKVPVPDVAKPRMTLEQALDLPVSNQMQHLRRLFESVDFTSFQPDSDWIRIDSTEASPDSLQPNHLVGGYGSHFGFVYSPCGDSFSVVLDRIRGNSIAAEWYDPRTGLYQSIGVLDSNQWTPFDPPSNRSATNDWVLVLKTLPY
jgi:hypothetical protein